ncbi:outer membrane lipoprotein carrier protein LolA [Rhodanobacter sp. DHG33]|uniref:outer membrane lipoprotein carrier protein LolA n=1 Tax=Rhodanobacter sp. DHG33 TaxID=2775921 RepID=UPI00177DD1BB|nr:outer membrane lipoprotein carrier protein LolA [Rhodanobacter sp. DHG33]MBD8898177.1 outer membrane lipoprotein carrier protein LolA [Rhodanobacter sp. DHG33]
MRRLMILLLLCCLAPFARAQADNILLQNVLAELGKHAAVRADFTQTRSNPALDKPQVSEGRLLFVLGHGMLWQTTTPYQETLALTGDRSARIDAEGHATAMHGDRGVSQVSQMLQGLLGGKLDEAQRQFDVAASGTPAQWTLRFVPKQARMARVLGSITLNGDDFLQGIAIAMQDGSRTEIHFEHTRDAGPLTAPEQRALGLP